MWNKMATVSLLISTCDKFCDLWDEHIVLLRNHWIGEIWKVYLVTDKQTDRKYEGIDIIVAGEDKDFPMRIKYAAELIDSDFILLTLDDYFIINDIHEEKLHLLVDRANNEHFDYLKLYDRRMTDPRKYEAVDVLYKIDLSRKYAITLYPAIWNRMFLINSVSGDMTAWKYEPSLTDYARDLNANCMFSHAGLFDILDVVRKGKVLSKANKYFKKHGIDIGDRPLIKRSTEIKLAVMDYISWYTPRCVFVAGKRVLKMFGKTFYSED